MKGLSPSEIIFILAFVVFPLVVVTGIVVAMAIRKSRYSTKCPYSRTVKKNDTDDKKPDGH